MMKFVFVAAAAVFLAGSAGAQAPVVVIAEEPALPREKVSFADLNLDSDAGQKRLVWRIRGAAARVCDDVGKTGLESLVFRGCFQTAVQDGTWQMERILTARESGASIAATALTISGN
jgi:UrcA family protein